MHYSKLMWVQKVNGPNLVLCFFLLVFLKVRLVLLSAKQQKSIFNKAKRPSLHPHIDINHQTTVETNTSKAFLKIYFSYLIFNILSFNNIYF